MKKFWASQNNFSPRSTLCAHYDERQSIMHFLINYQLTTMELQNYSKITHRRRRLFTFRRQ